MNEPTILELEIRAIHSEGLALAEDRKRAARDFAEQVKGRKWTWEIAARPA